MHKAVYKKEDFKRLDRRRSFSINSLNFYQAILQSSPQTRFMFDIKKLYIITRCAKIYSRRNSTGRVGSKTKHSKTKTEARSTQNSKTKHPNLENEAPYLENEAPYLENEAPYLENEAPKNSKPVCPL